MREVQVGIIGGTKGMGRWFARLLEGRGHPVHVTGRTSGMNLPELAALCEVVVVSVPIRATCAVIEEVGPHMRKEALLMDLTSLKKQPVKAMLESSESEVIGCHPLFGPQVESMEGHHVVLCPARADRWLPWLREIFVGSGASVVETTSEKHDVIMAAVQGLNHLNTVAMGLVMAALEMTMAEIKPFTTPIFETKTEIMRKVFCDNPGLYADIIALNPNMDRIVEEYGRIIATLGCLVTNRNAERLSGVMEEAADALFRGMGIPDGAQK